MESVVSISINFLCEFAGVVGALGSVPAAAWPCDRAARGAAMGWRHAEGAL